MIEAEKNFVVEGVDLDDGSRTTLKECETSVEATDFLTRYVKTEDAGGWHLIEIYDVRGEDVGCDAERIKVWSREECEEA